MAYTEEERRRAAREAEITELMRPIATVGSIVPKYKPGPRASTNVEVRPRPSDLRNPPEIPDRPEWAAERERYDVNQARQALEDLDYLQRFGYDAYRQRDLRMQEEAKKHFAANADLRESLTEDERKNKHFMENSTPEERAMMVGTRAIFSLGSQLDYEERRARMHVPMAPITYPTAAPPDLVAKAPDPKRKANGKKILEEKNAARKAGDVEGKRAQSKKLHKLLGNPELPAPATGTEQPLMTQWQRRSKTGAVHMVHRRTFTR